MGIPSGYTSAQVVQAVPTGINSARLVALTITIKLLLAVAQEALLRVYLYNLVQRLQVIMKV
jgi:hypothetical protein